MSRLLTATRPAPARITARATATTGTNSQVSRSLNRISKTNSARRAARKSRHADRASEKRPRGSFMGVGVVSVPTGVLSQSLQPGPGAGPETELRRRDPETGERDENARRRDPRERPSFHVADPLADFGHPRFVVANQSLERLHSLFDPR